MVKRSYNEPPTTTPPSPLLPPVPEIPTGKPATPLLPPLPQLPKFEIPQLPKLPLPSDAINHVEAHFDNCNIGIIAGNKNRNGRLIAPINIMWRNPKCNPPPPTPFTPPTNEPYWFKVPRKPGVVCVITFGMWTKHKVNLVIDVGGGHKTEQEMATEGYYFRFSYQEDESKVMAAEYGTSQDDEITGYINYTYSISYISNDIPTNGWVKFNLPTPQYYQDDRTPFLSEWEVLSNSCGKAPDEPTIFPPPPPPMTCNCCPNIQSNDELLRLILKRIGTPQAVTIFDEDMERAGEQKATKTPQTLFDSSKLNVERTEITNKLVGISNYPIEVPETIVEPYKEGVFENIFSFFQGDKKKKLNTLTEFLAWQVEQDSAVLGQFHQVLEFEQDFDGDGNAKTEKVVLPNVAETLKELMLLIVQLANNDGIKTGMLMNILSEVSNVKVNLFKTMQTIIDVQDYLDYPTRTREETVELLCNLKPTEDNQDFKDFMANSKVPVTFEDWTGENSMHDNILDLLQMAAMIRSMYFQRQ